MRATLAAQFADCFSRVSNIRDFKDDPQTQPWIQEVTLAGSGLRRAALGRAIRPPATAVDVVHLQRQREHQLQRLRDWPRKATNFTVSVGGDNLVSAERRERAAERRVDASSGFSNNDVARTVRPHLTWSVQAATSCGSGSYPIQSLFLGTPRTRACSALVRTSETAPAPGGVLGAPLQSFRAGTGPTPSTVYPTVGLDSSFYIGQKRVLRLPKCKTGNNDTNDCDLDSGSPNNSQSIDCEPATGGQGHDFQMFMTGCDPWYTDNPLRPALVVPEASPPPGQCPDKNGIARAPNAASYWQCVLKAPGFSPGVIADDIAAATENCDNIQNNSCHEVRLHERELLRPGDRRLGRTHDSATSPRRLPLHRALRVVQGLPVAGDTIPVLGFAAFYVTGWTAGNGNQTIPVPTPRDTDDDPATPP